MNNKLRVFEFKDGLVFAVAKDIEDYAASRGWRIKVDCNGQRHPGTVCNEHIRRVISHSNLRHHFGWRPEDVVSMHVNESNSGFVNQRIVEDLIQRGVINLSTVRNGYLDLYSLNAVKIIISTMLIDVDFIIPDEDIVVDKSYPFLNAHFKPHKWVNDKINTKTLFTVNTESEQKPKKSFIESNFTEEEKEVIRRYQRLLRETRQNGTRPYYKRNNFKEDKS